MSISNESAERPGVSVEWRCDTPPEPAGGPDFARMILALRQVQDRVAEAKPPNDVVADVAASFEHVISVLAPYGVEESDRIAGNRWDLPGRGQSLIPPILLTQADTVSVSGMTVFGPSYLGSGGAVNGGFLPLLFNELMGKLVQTGGRRYSRTAFLHVNYRSVARIGAQLRIEVKVVREEGRKRFLVGTLHDGSTLVADADALYVAVKETSAGAESPAHSDQS
jgi:hypothetical protein